MSIINEQIKRLREKADTFKRSGSAVDGIVKEFRQAADTIEELSAKLHNANTERSTAYYNDGWIPVSERLPEEGKEVLVWYRYCRYDKILYSNNIHHTYGIGYRCLDLWVVIDGGTETEVYGWMPLPKPYEPQERSEKK